jgi:hypothetical protein
MHTKAVHAAARGFQAAGVAVLRFNFRGVGASTGKYDEGRGEVDDARVALDFLAARRPQSPLWLVGFSFGSFVAMKLGRADARVHALIAIAPPVDRYDFSFLDGCQTPRLFVLAGKDELIDPQEAEWFHDRTAGLKSLCIIAGADHLFTDHLDPLAATIEGYARAWPPASGSRAVVGHMQNEDASKAGGRS